MESMYVKKPLYPILSIIASMLIFCVGLLISKEITILYFLGALTILYTAFGFGKILIKVVPIFFIIGGIIGFGSYLSNGDYIAWIQTLGRVMLLAYSSVITISFPPINLTRNLVQLKCPRLLTLGMLITVKFVPIIIDESRQIREAMKTRGVNVTWYNLSCLYRAFIVPFMIRIISISDIMAVSVETRGFDVNDKSTNVYKEINFTLRDGIFIVTLFLIMIGAIIVWKR